ncbi:MAG: PKD domain-containing protein, partial [Bacteroidales bacterium]|nr:PKD domain-containing protein [Bacteroidales bacterium]
AYENQGDYLAQLIVSNTFGCEDTTWVPLTISEAPEAAFSYENTCLGEPIQFFDESISAVDSIAAWFWNFNDPMSINDTSTLRNPTYAYNQAGIYDVILTITDTSGCVDEVIQEVIVAPNPTSYFVLGTASCQNAPVLFNDSSFTENNEIGTWIWNFGDGSPDSIVYAPNSPDIWYTYTTNGSYTVSLTTIDTSGCYGDTYYRYFEVRPIPLAGFMHSDTACQTGIIHFFDTSYHEPGVNAVAWEWQFGDGSYAFSQDPVHSYIETGQFYDVQMIVVDDYGCSDSIMQSVEVKPSMIISFTSDMACEGTPTQLIANLIQPENDEVAEWRWFFGDNSDTIVQTDTIYHNYSQGGTYYVTLIGVDEGGCETIVINQAVNVNFAPDVDFYIPTASCNDPTIFYDHSVANADSIIIYHFDFGDGTYVTYNSADYPDPVNHDYPAGSEEYTATITLTNSNGCEQTTEFLVARESCITMAFDVSLPACIGKPVQFVNQSFINHDDVEVDSIFWNFGDGVIYELPLDDGDTVYHTYQAG